MNYQSIIFQLCYPYDLFESHFQTYAYVLIRWSDYLRVETFLFGACNNVHCKFRFIIGLNYTPYNFFNVNSLLRTRSSLQYEIRRFTWETSYLFIRRVRKVRKATISFVMPLCPSVYLSVRLYIRPHGIIRFPLNGHSWNFTFEYFSKSCWGTSSFVKIWYEQRARKPIHIFF